MAAQSKIFRKLSVSFKTPNVDSAPDMVIGRTELVHSLWRKVHAGSIRLLSERRMGKTWVLKLSIAMKPEWAAPLMFDAEGAHSAEEFVWQLNKRLHGSDLIPHTWWDKIQDWFRRFSQRIQGTKVASIEISRLDPWGSLLEDTCRHFAEKSKPRQAVLMIDELPFFLDNIMRTRGPEEAIEVLDKLRSLRQTIPSLRMVFCGSLGMHIVLQKLREAGYAGQPVNDMPPFEVPPLAPEDACYLSGCLLVGEGISCSDIKKVARSIAQVGSGVPHYIQHIVSWMCDQQTEPWTPEMVASIPSELFNASGDPAEFAYYDGRLDQYYPPDIVEKSRAALDVLSRKADGLHFDELLNLVRHRPKTLMVDSESFLQVLRVLRDDHYVVHKNGQWRFKVEIIRQWWFEARGRLAL